MAKEIIWSHRAKNDRRFILDYWQKRNKSKVYSRKLFKLFQQAVKQISEYPTIGKPTTLEKVRAFVVKDYLIFYETFSSHILVLTIWDARQNPDKLRL